MCNVYSGTATRRAVPVACFSLAAFGPVAAAQPVFHYGLVA